MQAQSTFFIDPQAARLVLASQGKTFYWASFFLPSRMATAATRLYHFCRYVDDVADTSDQPAQASLALDQIMADIRRGQSQQPMVADAIALFEQYQIPLEIPLALVQGVRADLSMTQLPDEAALVRYCYRVAGTVGIMMAKLLGVTDPQAFHHAIDLGIAMQLTNICRDVTEDAGMQRVYLPQSLLQSPDHMTSLKKVAAADPRVLSAIGVCLHRADAYYASGYAGLSYLPLRARFGMFIAASLYQRIGHRILRAPQASLTQRIFVTSIEKIWVIITGLCVGQFKHRLWEKPTQRQHQQALHHDLRDLPLTHASAI